MIPDTRGRRTAAPGALSRAASVAVVLVAGLVLAGWLLDISALKSVLPGLVTMKANTAVAFIAAAVALWLLAAESRDRRVRRVADGCALGVAAVGLLTLCEYLFGWDLRLDQWLFREPPGAPGTFSPGRMAPTTALNFLLLGAALVGLDARPPHGRRLAEGLTLTAAFIALLALIGYAYNVPAFYGIAHYTRMALHTALLFLLLCAGVLASRRDGWLAAIVMSEGAGGVIARRLLPVVIVIPPLLGWMRLQGQRAGLYGTEFGASLTILASIVLLALAVFWSAATLNRMDVERKRAEEALRDAERRLFQLLEAMPVGVFVVDGAGQAYYANQTAQEILGKGIVRGARADELPEVYRAYVAGTDELYPADKQPIVRALAGERARTADIEIHRLDRTVPIEVWAAPVFDAAGRVSHAIAAFTDITERRRAQAEIERLNAELSRRIAELEVANQELETFSYSVSHDLRAPLRAIDGFSRILLEDHRAALDTEGERLLGVIRANTKRMAELIDDLLTFSRFSRKSLDAGPVEMQALVQAVVEDLRNGVAPKPVEIVVGPLSKAYGDAALLRQVWANLIGNALKFTRTRPQPRVEIGSMDGASETVFSVRDNGVGFDMEYARKLFGVFQRLHQAEEFEGSGVGLAIVQRIVHRHGGRVWAEAEPGRGATFYFTLPALEG